MKRLFILIAVCMIGMVNALAGITVVPPQDQEHDFYELTFSGTVTSSDWNNLSDNVKNAKSLKIVTKDGYKLNSVDMAILMGNTQPSLFRDRLESLDMSDAELDSGNQENPYSDLSLMTNASGDDATGLIHLKYFVFPKETTVIPTSMFQNNDAIEEVIMLESDATGFSRFKAIPENCFQCCSKLKSVRIPEGVKYIGASAFGGTKDDPAPPLENIHFPNSLESIGSSAFAYNSALKSVTIPAGVTSIGDNAFQYNDELEDVYVLGDHVTIGDGSFSQEYTYDGFSFDNNNDGNSSTVSIRDWKSEKDYVKHPVRLHIPKNSDAYVFCVNPFLRALNALTPDELALLDNYQSNDDLDVKLKSYGIDPSKKYLFQNNWVEMEGHRYFKKPQAMFNKGCWDQNLISEDIAPQGSENFTSFNGWHNFMFAAGDVEEKTWPDNRLIESRWYTAVFPFNLTYDQLMTTYGNGTDVREFTGVISETDGNKTKLTITFNQRVPIPANRNSVYIEKGHPYMIHPGVRSVDKNNNPVSRTIAGVSVAEANDEIENGTPLTVPGDLKKKNGETITVEQSGVYTFVGTYEEEGDYLPAHCYYLGMYEGQPKSLKFYYTKTEGTTAKNWKQFTSIVMTSLGANGAKSMDMDFSIFNQNVFNDNYGIATSIEKAQTERELSDRIYNLNGQVVGKGSLQSMPKGIYVVNGKKIVVR